MSDTVITNYITAVTVDGDQVAVEISPTGPPGQGVPAGGTAGQVLKKASGADYDTEWGDDTEGVQTVTGDGVGGTATDVVLTYPTPADIGAYPDTNPAGFIDAGGAPVQSVTGTAVTGTASEPVINLPTPADIGAYPDTNPDGFVDAAGAANAAPVQSVNGQTGDVVLGAGDVGAETAWVVTTDNTGELTGTNVLWLADTSAARNRALDVNGERLQVKDVTGSAGTNNITLTAGSGQTINGNATETIDVNYGWVEYVRSGTNWVTIGGQ